MASSNPFASGLPAVVRMLEKRVDSLHCLVSQQAQIIASQSQQQEVQNQILGKMCTHICDNLSSSAPTTPQVAPHVSTMPITPAKLSRNQKRNAKRRLRKHKEKGVLSPPPMSAESQDDLSDTQGTSATKTVSFSCPETFDISSEPDARPGSAQHTDDEFESFWSEVWVDAENEVQQDVHAELIKSLNESGVAGELAVLLQGKVDLSLDELSTHIVTQGAKLMSHEIAREEIEQIYLDLRAACTKLGYGSHLEVDLHFSLREALPFYMDENEGTGDIVLREGFSATHVVQKIIQEGYNFKNPADSDPEFDHGHDSEPDYFFTPQASAKMNASANSFVPTGRYGDLQETSPLDAKADIFVPAGIPETNVPIFVPTSAPGSEVSDLNEYEGKYDPEESDVEHQYFFLRPDNDVELKSPQWLRDQGFPLLAPALFGSRACFHSLSWLEKERLCDDALTFGNERNPQQWHEWYPEHIRWLRDSANWK